MIRFVLTTFPDPDAADRAARLLVSEHLAACATIIPEAKSVYRWKGAIEESHEAAVLIKTAAASFPALEKRLKEIHPYETPEIASFEAADVSKAYADWVLQSCTAGNPSASPAR
jgi:periplasmic divalent cation tolerance protein